MKKKDLTLIVIVMIISAALSFALSSVIFGDPETDPIEVETTDVLTDDFSAPSNAYFNEDSINPTQLIRIGQDEEASSPFGQSD